jgi:hypothetical protein
MAKSMKEKEILLSEDDQSILIRLSKNNMIINHLLRMGETRQDKRMIILLDKSQSERIRTVLTGFLAETGFNADYSISKAGKELEELIDKFFIE